MFTALKNNLLWSQGQPIVLGCLIFAGISWLLFPILLYGVLGFFIFSVYFFRYPQRFCREALISDAILVCPADGKVVDIQYSHNNDLEGYAQKVSIFLSPFDVHVNWVPFAGTIEKMLYRPGAFMCAFLPKSSELNERNDLVFKRLHTNQTVLVRQIAGTVARRICWWVKTDDAARVGDTFGMIRFGSRVDILFPVEIDLKLVMGQRVYGGQTVFGEWR